MFDTRPRTENWTLSISINPKKPTKRGCYLALTFGTLLSSQGADARDARPGEAIDRGGCSTLRRSPCPSSGGSRTRARRSERRHLVQPTSPGLCSRSPLGCRAGGAWSDLRVVTRSPSRSGLAGRREKVTSVSSGLSNRPGVTGDTRVERHRHTPFTWADPRRTPATERLPRRSTSQPPGSQSPSPGTVSASVTRSLLR